MNNETYPFDLIVVGGGASGMTAAICAARNHKKVLLIEKNAKLGKKIAVSGNGKCNITNADIAPQYYHDDSEQLKTILSLGNHDTVIAFLRSCGIVCKEKRGYVYPVCEQASSVVEALEEELLHWTVTIHKEECLQKIIFTKEGYFLSTNQTQYKTKALILSCGGMAYPKLGAEDTGFLLLKELGHRINKPTPALVSLDVREKQVKKLQGVRQEANIRLFLEFPRKRKESKGINKTKRYEESGEIIFNETGISGIPVFQLSRYVPQALESGANVTLSLNVLPNLPIDEVQALVLERKRYHPSLPLEALFRPFCNHKIVYFLLLEQNQDPTMPCGTISDGLITKLCESFYQMTFQIIGTKGFDFAQVTKGGVPLFEINPNTMESKLCPGLYITGELLDVDGMCGGYNLHFAWATGILAGRASLGRLE